MLCLGPVVGWGSHYLELKPGSGIFHFLTVLILVKWRIDPRSWILLQTLTLLTSWRSGTWVAGIIDPLSKWETQPGLKTPITVHSLMISKTLYMPSLAWPSQKTVAGSIMVSISQGRESGLRAVMGLLKVIEGRAETRTAWLLWLLRSLFSMHPTASLEKTTAQLRGNQETWFERNMFFSRLWIPLLPRFQIRCDHLLNLPIASPAKQEKM